MSVGLFFQLLICAVSLAVYMMGMETSKAFGLTFFVSISGIVNNLTATYIYCLLSENVTLDLGMIGNNFYDCAWYQLPVRQQRLFAVPIQWAQLEFRMTGLGWVECSLRVFTAVSFFRAKMRKKLFKKFRKQKIDVFA